MKKKFQSISMACHVWAQRSQPEGEGGNVFFEHDTIYSYGRHFPIATFVDNAKNGTRVIFNSDGYSPSTSSHKSEVRGAARHYEPFLYADTETLKTIVLYRKELSEGGKTARKAITGAMARIVERKIVSQAKAAAGRRLARKKQDEIDAAISYYKNAEDLLSFFDCRLPASVTKQLETLKNNFADIIKQNEKQIIAANKKAAKARAEKEAADAIKAKEAAELFLSGEKCDLYYLRKHEPLLLRIVGDNIETSQGATFPIEHGKKAWPLIKSCKERGKIFERNGKTIHLGHFQIDRIEVDGTIKAGCHTVAFPEVERIAKQLNIA